MKFTYWFLVFVLLHTWIGYLILLSIISRIKIKDFQKKDICPFVTIIVTVHNEEKQIERRIVNLLESGYPEDSIEILVASDGSTDATNNIVESMIQKDSRLKLFTTEGGGKSATQNKAIPLAKGQIIILTDADTIFAKEAIKEIAQNFADERVGCVTGRLIFVEDDNTIAQSQGLYWKYEMLLRRLESKIGIMHTASGAIMAFRKALFRPFECQYGDDCIIPLDVVLQGYLVIHEDDAVAFDTFESSIKGELKARTRMTLRNITCTISKYPLLNPVSFPLISLSIFSHKILRWLTPYIMLVLLLANIMLFNSNQVYQFTLYSQVIFYLLCLVGFISERKKWGIPIASHAFSFMLANIGFFLGVMKAIMGRNIMVYKN